MKKLSLGALVAAGLLMGGLTAGSASAADLGGNCCADLEERIAELEATTARKGNRKVSLTISGWVAEQIMGWDDGSERNVYVGGLGTTLATNVKFTGQATISPGWYAGYVLHLEADGSDSLTQNQNIAQGPDLYGFLATNGSLISGLGGQNNFAHVLQSFWFVKSDHLGKVGIGLQSQASDNTAILVDGSGSLVPANWVAFDVNGFGMRLDSGSLNYVGPLHNAHFGWGMDSCRGMGGSWGDCNGLPQDSVRYDSPTFAGFSVSASWGQDHFWDVAARYAGEWNGIKVAAAAAYNEVTDGNYNNVCTALGADGGVIAGTQFTGTCNKAAGGFLPSGSKEKYFQVGAYIEHVPTGVFGYGAYGRIDQDGPGARLCPRVPAGWPRCWLDHGPRQRLQRDPDLVRQSRSA